LELPARQRPLHDEINIEMPSADAELDELMFNPRFLILDQLSRRN
jgi:hypothetical protein